VFVGSGSPAILSGLESYFETATILHALLKVNPEIPAIWADFECFPEVDLLLFCLDLRLFGQDFLKLQEFSVSNCTLS